VWGVNGDVALGGSKPRRLLAALALHLGETVSTGQLIDIVWDGSPPRSARENLLTYLWSLRRSLKSAGCPGLLISASPPGYVLTAPPDEVDWLRFTTLAEVGRQCLDADPAAAASSLRAALELWRGPALADVADSLPALRARIDALDEARLIALELRIQADLARGGHEGLVAELGPLVAEHPLREQLRGSQMMALYRSGRQAEALATFRRLRELLADELGIDPTPDLQRLHEAMLRGDPQLAPPAPVQGAVPGPASASPSEVLPREAAGLPRAPRQLTAPVAGFIGRFAQLSQLDAVCRDTTNGGRIVAITGPAGVGKTALAIRWAHQVQDQFPDGTLFADLRGYDPVARPAEPGEVLDGFLRTLGVPTETIPPAEQARAALLRSVLSDQRILLVLDNAATAAQLRPLLPGSPRCMVVSTSRSTLSGLVARDGAVRIPVPPLAGDESIALLRGRVGPQRADGEPEATAEVARLCGGFPLALRIAAERAALTAGQPIAELASQLADEHDRLRVLATDDDDTAVSAAFWLSYQRLEPPASRLFRLLGLHPGPEFSLPAARAVAMLAQPAARAALAALTGVHLLEQTGHDRFRFHDLIAAYAAERAADEESDAARGAAVRQVLSWYLYTADAADGMLIPQRPRRELPPAPDGCQPLAFATREEAMTWCESERVNLVAAARQALAAGEYEIAWLLPAALSSFYMLSRLWHDWVDSFVTGLEATRQLGDRAAEAMLLAGLGAAYGDLARFDDAHDCLARALGLLTDLGDRQGQGRVQLNLGFLNWKRQRYDEGTACFQEALAIFTEIDEPYGKGMALNNLGEAWRERVGPEEGLPFLRRALDIFRGLGDRYSEAAVLDSLGCAYRDLRRFDEALRTFRQAIALRAEVADRHGEALTLTHIAEALELSGDEAQARDTWRQALAIYTDLGDPRAAGIRDRCAATGTPGAEPGTARAGPDRIVVQR
jgi:DNA-binding SARP family transcriptional activator/tetratricopeptide (TPR) repeat protein